jgi:hypothetical protein
LEKYVDGLNRPSQKIASSPKKSLAPPLTTPAVSASASSVKDTNRLSEGSSVTSIPASSPSVKRPHEETEDEPLVSQKTEALKLSESLAHPSEANLPPVSKQVATSETEKAEPLPKKAKLDTDGSTSVVIDNPPSDTPDNRVHKTGFDQVEMDAVDTEMTDGTNVETTATSIEMKVDTVEPDSSHSSSDIQNGKSE